MAAKITFTLEVPENNAQAQMRLIEVRSIESDIRQLQVRLTIARQALEKSKRLLACTMLNTTEGLI